MDNLFKVKVMCVNAVNINKVKFKYKTRFKNFKHSFQSTIFYCLASLSVISIVYLAYNILVG